jgi:hypothetical protein
MNRYKYISTFFCLRPYLYLDNSKFILSISSKLERDTQFANY